MSAGFPTAIATPSTTPVAPRPVTDAISALVNLGYGQPQAAAAIAAASRSAGEKAETAQLIRLGLKELAR